MTERTLIILKPDVVQRRLLGEIISRFEAKGFKLVAAKLTQVSEQAARELYVVHKGKEFYEPLVKFLVSSPSLLTVWEADGIIETARRLIGPTSGFEAVPGTIRGDYSLSTRYNLVHGSDSRESVEREIKVFFSPDEIVDYQFSNAPWVYDRKG